MDGGTPIQTIIVSRHGVGLPTTRNFHFPAKSPSRSFRGDHHLWYPYGISCYIMYTTSKTASILLSPTASRMAFYTTTTAA
jgi:hypothetical protein